MENLSEFLILFKGKIVSVCITYMSVLGGSKSTDSVLTEQLRMPVTIVSHQKAMTG